MTREVVVIGAPVDMGAGRRGVDLGPGAIRYAGLRERLVRLGHQVRDLGNLVVPLVEQIAPPARDEKLRYLEPLVAINRALAESVAGVVAAGGFPLMLGGDHSMALGSIAGSARGRRLGVVWIDAHGDFNTPATTHSGNIHGMPLAALTGRGHVALTRITGAAPIVRDADIALVGIRDLDPGERAALHESGVHVFTMHDIDRRGMTAVIDEAIARVAAATDGLHLSLDLDALDPVAAPGVGTPVPGGLSYRETHLACEMLAETGQLVSMDLVEVNPILDRENMTAELAVVFALSALGQKIY